MDTVEKVFVGFGGPTAFAGAIGLKTSAASEMRRRSSIPSRYWTSVVEAARKRGIRGITFESLARMHEQPSESPTKRRAHEAAA